MRGLAGLMLMLALGVGAAFAGLPGGAGSPEPAQATHGKICGVVAKGKSDYQVLGLRVSCGKAIRGAKKYLKRRKPLAGFKCKRNVGRYRFVCKKRGSGKVKSYRAQKL